jgi:hypothetical protein
MSDDRITAPWSAEQVDALNRFQRAHFMHPFTCPGHDGGGDRDLVATRAGWVCCHCDYRQDWAHSFMLDKPVEHMWTTHCALKSEPPE